MSVPRTDFNALTRPPHRQLEMTVHHHCQRCAIWEHVPIARHHHHECSWHYSVTCTSFLFLCLTSHLNHDTNNRLYLFYKKTQLLSSPCHQTALLLSSNNDGTGRIASSSLCQTTVDNPAYDFYTVYDCWIISTSKFFRRTTDSTCPFKVFNSRNLQQRQTQKIDHFPCNLDIVKNCMFYKRPLMGLFD